MSVEPIDQLNPLLLSTGQLHTPVRKQSGLGENCLASRVVTEGLAEALPVRIRQC